MALHPVNDLAKIELDTDLYGFSDDGKDTAESGVLVELPDKFNFFGFWSFAFEDSFMSEEKLKKLYAHYEKMIGQRVYWTALSERGNVIKSPDGKRYAFLKLTSLIAADEDKENKAVNLHADGSGAFKASM